MRTLFNILWLALAGIWMTSAYALAGMVMFITIIGIPLGVGSFKLAAAALVPFGKEIVETSALAQDTPGAISF
jgi:uncharacterized membrane protein YccF (DUF307 family)